MYFILNCFLVVSVIYLFLCLFMNDVIQIYKYIKRLKRKRINTLLYFCFLIFLFFSLKMFRCICLFR